MGLLLFHAWLLNPQQKRPLEFPFMNQCTSHFCIQRVILLKPNYNLLNFWLIDNGARWYKILQKVSFQSQFYFSDVKLLKMSHFKFSILAFSTNFCPIKVDLSGNTVWPQTTGFKILPKLTFLAFFLNFCPLNIARFARNVECDFLGDFQHCVLT